MAAQKKIRGSLPNPLPPGMDLGARIAADKQRERHEGDVAARSSEDLFGAEDGKVFGEFDKKSYTQQPTETQEEMTRQQKMEATRRQFLPDASAEETQEPRERTEAPRSSRERNDDASAEQTQEARPLNRAAQLYQARLRDKQARDAEEAENPIAKGFDALQESRRTYQLFRRIAEAGSGVGILLLVLELNAQCALSMLNVKNPFFTKASKPEILTCVVLDCGACMGQMFVLCPVIIIIIGLIGGGTVFGVLFEWLFS